MGEVYRARDTRLGRAVALKILHFEQPVTENARARFQREAQAISALSHPNICTLYDVGRHDETDFIVMELLDGETLSDRLSRGSLSPAEVIRYGVDVAAALEHAHRHGVIHRDLKPANVLITKAGAKLLDFGVAKLLRAQEMIDTGASAVDVPTVEEMTRDGALAGTLEFMAPEVLQGRPADARSDIFAFGNVLYRMLTGRKPFSGDTRAAVIASIFRDEAAPSGRPGFDALIGACLAKDPCERMQSAHDCKLALEWMQRPRDGTLETPPRRKGRFLATAAIALAIVGAATWAALSRFRGGTRDGVRRFSIGLPAPFDNSTSFAISPDAKRLVISMNGAAGRQLYMRSFDDAAFVPIDGTQNAISPFFSPDSRWIAFMANGKLKKLNLSGGVPVTICDAPRPRGGTWGADDSIVFAPMSTDAGLYRVPAAGGQPKEITTVDRPRGERSHRWPRFLPDGRHVIFTVDDWSADYTRKSVAVVDVQTGKRTTLLTGACDASYLVGGYLLFGGDHTLNAVRFDPSTLVVSSLPVTVIDRVFTHVGIGHVAAEVAADGTLVYAAYDASAAERELVWVDRSGGVQPASDVWRPFIEPQLSPDMRQLLVGAGEQRASDLWLLNLETKSWSRIAAQGKSLAPLWSPAGDRIFFSSNRLGVYNIFSMASDGSGPATQITNHEHWPFARSVSPNGRTLLIDLQDPVTSFDVWTVDVETHHETPLLTSPADETEAKFSPDGNWFAYASNETGAFEVYVQHYPPDGRKWPVSSAGGRLPRWKGDGSEIYFRTAKGVMAASVTTTPSFSVATPHSVVEGVFAVDYEVANDGSRFLMLKESDHAALRELNVTLGWPEEVKRKLAPSQ
jgi:serine/threonine protein kinase/Tol biopolymer transport system component